jgi:type IV secretory pathway ATPase VirB11/archaellum biosynthesis ATPase
MEIELNPLITSLPKPVDKSKLDVRYGLIPPFAYAHIHWDKEKNEMIYELEEPILNEKEKAIFKKLEDGFKEVINIDVLVEKNTAGILDYIEKTVKTLVTELNISIPANSYEKIVYYLFRNFIGMNELEPLLRDYHIEDVECNGVGTPVFIVHRSYRTIKTNLVYKDMEELANFVEKLAQKCGRYISYASPLLDGALPDGSRVNATYTKDVTSRGPTFCFKYGKVQLSDGTVRNISELFEEAKKNFGFKIEDGNEVVDVCNVSCCGVEAKNLQQKDCIIKSIIKLSPPKKLVKVQFDDGGEIEVTTNHLFHVAGNQLELVEAKDLKEGMIVPMPGKLDACGYRQNINVYSLIKDFSYSKKVCIASSQKIKEIVTNEIHLNNKNGNFRQVLSQKYGVGNSYFYEIMSRGNSISFNVLNEICKNQDFDFNSLRDLSVSVYGGGTKNKTKSVKIPNEIDEELAYLVGALISDGHLSKDFADFSCFGERGFQESVKKALFNKFGRFDSYYNDKRVYLCSQFIPFFFNKVFGIPIGKKSRTVKIPDIIFKSDNRVIASFIKGLFDGDGTINSGLSYKTYSKELAEGLTYLLARFGIYCYLRKDKEEHRVNIPSPYYQMYRDLIGFSSEKKAEGLNNLIEKQTEHKTFIRHERIPGFPVLSIIKKLGIKKKELLKDCGFSYNRIYQICFSKNFARRLLSEIEKNENAQLVKAEIDYIKWMLESKQEFVRVCKIESVDNNEPVYDLEIEPCKFFVAGNKPMNIFDTIRKFTKVPWTPIQLISSNAVCPEMLAYLWILVEHKSNILIAGGTGSGKTTLLNAVAFFIPQEARVVSIEDSVTGDSKILIKEKEKIKQVTIKEFVDKKIDAEVMTLDEKGGIIFVKPSAYIKHKVKKDIYEILTSTGRRVKVTKDHSLFSLGNKGLVEIKPTDLKENESFIAVPRILPITGEEIKEINLMNHLECFKEDFICGEPIKKIFKKYSCRELNAKKERYRWWKNHNLIKISEFLKLKYKFSYDEIKKLVIKSKNKAFIPVIFKITPEFLEFCGLWLGDGSYDNYNKNSVILSNADEKCRQVFKNITSYLKSNFSVMNDGGVSLRIHNSVFYKFMKHVLRFNGYSNTKKIPEFIFGLSNEQIKHFIRGYFSADGCMKKNEVSCASQSIAILDDLQTMLLRFGIISRINDFERKDKCINMSISSWENIDRFKEIGFLQERKNEKLEMMNKKASHTCSDIIPLTSQKLQELNKIANEKIQSGYLNGFQNIGREYMQKISPFGSEFNDLSHNDILWDKIKKIRKVSSDKVEVFDLSIPKHEKFLCNNIFVHNTRELNLPRENWVPSVARAAAGIKKVGEIDLFDLLKNSFRQTPEYVIVGEVRGKEAFVLFQGMASGHAAISTIHAESVDTIIKRLSTPPIELSPSLINTLDAVTIMTHAIVNKQETRRLTRISEIVNVPEVGPAILNTPFIWNPAEDKFYFKKDSKVFEKIAEKYGTPVEELWKEWEKRKSLLEEMANKKMFSFEQFQKDINDYYKNPEVVLKKYGIE